MTSVANVWRSNLSPATVSPEVEQIEGSTADSHPTRQDTACVTLEVRVSSPWDTKGRTVGHSSGCCLRRAVRVQPRCRRYVAACLIVCSARDMPIEISPGVYIFKYGVVSQCMAGVQSILYRSRYSYRHGCRCRYRATFSAEYMYSVLRTKVEN